MEEGKKFTKSMYFWLLIPYLIPILGGVIVNQIYKKKNKEFAYFCLTSAMFNPLLIQFIIGFLMGSTGILFLTEELSLIYITLLLGIPINYLVLAKTLKGNTYRYFYPIYWYSLIGAIFSYYKEKDKTIKEKFGTFVIPFFIVNILVNVLITSIFTIYTTSETSEYFEYVIPKVEIPPLSTLKLVENQTLFLEVDSYNSYPIELEKNQVVNFEVNVIGEGTINTVMVDSDNYDSILYGGYIYYFVDSYTSGVKNADVRIQVPETDKYYIVISTEPMLEGQDSSDKPVTATFTVYTS